MRAWVLAACVAVGVVNVARADEPALPAGAVARIGGVGIAHPGDLRDFAFSPDGKTVATIGDNTPRVWDVATGRLVRELAGAHKGVGVAVAFSPDGRTLATAAGEPGVVLWDTATGKQLARFPTAAARGMTFSPDGKTLAVSGITSSAIELVDVEARVVARHIKRGQWTDQFAFSPDGRTLAVGGYENAVLLYEVATGDLRATIAGLKHQAAGVAFSPGGTLYVASGDAPLKAHDPLTGKELKAFEAPAWRVAVSPDGKTVAAFSFKGEVRLLDAATGKEVRKWAAQAGPTQKIAFGPDGKRVATTGWKHTRVHVYDAETGQEAYAEGHDGAVAALALSPDGTVLATADDQGVRLWSVPANGSPRLLRRVDVENTFTVRALAMSPDGRRVVAGASLGNSRLKMVRVWEVASGTEVLAVQGLDDPRSAYPITCGGVAFSPDGKKLAAGGHDAGVHVWDAATGKELARHGSGRPGSVSVAFGADGKTVYSAEWSGPLRAWSLDPNPEKLVRVFEGPHPRCVATARSAPVVAAGGVDGTVRVWNAEGKLLFQGAGPGMASAVAVSSDGKMVASAGSDSIIRVWDVTSGEQRAALKGHHGRVNGLAFAPDGRLVSAGGDAAVYVWAAPGRTELDRQWDELAAADAAAAFRAIGELVGKPDRAVPYLADRLPKPDAERVRALIGRLASGDGAAAAAAELARLGALAEPELRRSLKGNAASATAWVEKLLDPKRPLAWPNEGVRFVRAVEALERIGTPAAREVLRKVVAEWGETAPGRDAAAALERLGSRKP